MRLDFTPEQVAWRNEIRAFLKENLPEEYDDELSSSSRKHFDFMMEFNRKLAAKGWLTMSWPEEYGGAGAGLMEQLIFHEEYGYHRAPNLGPGVRFVGPSIMTHGTDEQKKEHLPYIAANTRWWCQGFSEPGSGSDLASLQTRGVVDGDDIVVNGSKIWTSWAHMADWCWLAVRTDPDAPKHRGISILMVDMKWPGITIRPVPNMAGYHSFNQVFFDDLRVPRANMVGPMNRGWYVMTGTLDHERATRITNAGAIRRGVEEFVEYAKATKGPDGRTLAEDPILAGKLAQLAIDAEIARLLAYRTVTVMLHGGNPDRESSSLKLWCSELAQRLAQAGVHMLGPAGLIRTEGAGIPFDGRVASHLLQSYSQTMGSGTSEVQRNIIATRGLGMPR